MLPGTAWEDIFEIVALPGMKNPQGKKGVIRPIEELFFPELRVIQQ